MKKKPNSENIYFKDFSKVVVNTNSIFTLSIEGDKLRVKNDHVNCLFNNLNSDEFDNIYNKFFKHLNFDFSSILIKNKEYKLSKNQQECLIQKTITHWIYYYSVNQLEIKVIESDFRHPQMIDKVLCILDQEYGVDTNVSLIIGAKILRQKYEDYCSIVKRKREYYDR